MVWILIQLSALYFSCCRWYRVHRLQKPHVDPLYQFLRDGGSLTSETVTQLALPNHEPVIELLSEQAQASKSAQLVLDTDRASRLFEQHIELLASNTWKIVDFLSREYPVGFLEPLFIYIVPSIIPRVRQLRIDGKSNEAKQSLQRILNLPYKVTDGLSLRNRDLTLNALGLLEWESGELEQAMRTLKEACNANFKSVPWGGASLFNYGRLLKELDRSTK